MVSPKSRSPQPFFSIVIPTLNEEKFIPLLLTDLSKQSFSNFEVVVVDGKSTDATQRQVEKFQTHLCLSFVKSNKRGVAYQRNQGGRLGKGTWLLFMDADNRLPYYFLEGIHYQLSKHPHCDIFTSLIDADSQSPSAILTTNGINVSTLIQEKAGSYFCLGAFIGLRSSVRNQVKFDPHYTVGEDSEFVRAAARLGYKFMVFKDPTYTFSLRRLRKEGMLKMTAINAKVMLKSLGSQSLTTSNQGYVMLGGGYYAANHQQNSSSTLTSVKKITKFQLQKAKKFANSIMKPIQSHVLSGTLQNSK